MELSNEQIRVLGCLIEKELTTPDYYPLTTNALVTACNQSSNREPVVSYNEETVMEAVQGLRAAQLARSVKAIGSRALKHRHDLDSALRLDVPERSVLAIMMLRGPQTVGELRTRTERYHDFADLDEVEAALSNLAAEMPPLAERLERQPGQKEPRWRHLLGGETVADTPSSIGESVASAPDVPDRAPLPASQKDLEALVAELAARVDRLERELGIDG